MNTQISTVPARDPPVEPRSLNEVGIYTVRIRIPVRLLQKVGVFGPVVRRVRVNYTVSQYTVRACQSVPWPKRQPEEGKRRAQLLTQLRVPWRVSAVVLYSSVV